MLLQKKLLTKKDVDDNRAAFENTQGYTLVSHGREHVWLALLRFQPKSGSERKELAKKLSKYGRKATSAYDLYSSYQAHLAAKAAGGGSSPSKRKSSLVRAVGLSSQGYAELLPDYQPPGMAFRAGFQPRQLKVLPDLPAERYSAVLVLASNDDVKQLFPEQRKITADFGELADIRWERGYIRKSNGVLRDHFGYADGISQPVFFDTGAGQRSARVSSWDPSATLSYVLTRESSAPASAEEYGSHMAFMKIEQDRNAFETLVRHFAEAAGVEAKDVKSWIMGRDVDGAPLTPGGEDSNDFDFGKDPDFSVCPAAAHVRKVNPRTEHGRNHRILRRSAFYDTGNGEVGTLFQCFQSKLETGFEHVFSGWALKGDHPQAKCGEDALLGSRDCPPMLPNVTLNGSVTLPFSIRSFVKVKEGEYFYFPSIPFFKRLGAYRRD